MKRCAKLFFELIMLFSAQLLMAGPDDSLMRKSYLKDSGNGSLSTIVHPGGNIRTIRYSVNEILTREGSDLPIRAADAGFICGASTISDVDGNTYNTIQIGSQCWMKENLRVTHFADGAVLGMNGSGTTTYYQTPGDPIVYGLLYNLAAATRGWQSNMTPSYLQGICPTGWHVPSYGEVLQLKNFVIQNGGYGCGGYSNYIAKALASTVGWPNTDTLPVCAVANNPAANNLTGFSFVPHGYYFGEFGGGFGSTGYSWTATPGNNSYSSGLYYDIDVNSTEFIPNATWATAGAGLAVRCIKGNTFATVFTNPASDVTDVAAVCGGQVTLDGGEPVTAKGICWSTSPNPTINNTHTTDGNGIGSFVSTLTNLMPGTTYYYCAYATNSIGTIYGSVESFVTDVACHAPIAVSANNVTATDATISWVGEENNYNVRYREHSELDLNDFSQVGTDRTTTGTSAAYDFDLTAYAGQSGHLAIRHYDISDMFILVVEDIALNNSEGNVLYADFSNGIPSDWKVVDNDGDGFNWEVSGNLMSSSFINGYGAVTPDNWLITPYVPLGGTLTIHAYGRDPNWAAENFGVFVNTTGQPWMVENGIAGNTCEIHGLTPITEYDVQVQADCNEDGVSLWSGVMNFITDSMPTAPITTDTSAFICDSYEWNGQTYTVSGDYIWTGTAADGRDSIVTLHLTVWTANQTSFTASACNSYVWNGVEYTVSGDYTQTFANVYGCDSVVTLHLTINPNPNVQISGPSSISYGENVTLEVSGADTYVWNAGATSAAVTDTPTATTTYSVTGTDANGCSAEAFKTVTVNYLAPTVVAYSVQQTSCTTADYNAEVMSDGGLPVSNRGVCWSTSPNPTIGDNHTEDGAGMGAYGNTITGLTPNTTYYVRPYATNGMGTAYGQEITLMMYLVVPKMNSDVYVMTDTVVSVYDHAGPNANYDSYADGSLIIYAPSLSEVLSITGAYQIENEYDHLYIYDGEGFGTLLADLSGSSSISTPIQTSQHILTLRFTSDYSVTQGGFAIDIRTQPCSKNSSMDTVICESSLPITWNGHYFTEAGSYSNTYMTALGCDSTVTYNLYVSNRIGFLRGESYFTEPIGDERIVLLADYDNDSLTDMITRIHPSGEIRFYHNTSVTMAYDYSLYAPNYAFSNGTGNTNEQDNNATVLADFDNDGINDLLVHGANFWNCSSNFVRVYWGSSTYPYFNDATYTELNVTNPYCIGAYGADLNNDGLLDVFIRNCRQTNLYMNQGNRSFVQTSVFNTNRDINVIFDDYDLDGNLDLCYTKNGWADGSWGVRFNKGNGDGTFNTNTIVNYQSERPYDGFLNFDADPLDDIIPDFAFTCSQDGANGARVYVGEWNSSLDNFEFSNFDVISSEETRIVQSFDANADGYEDVIVRGRSGNLYSTIAYLNDGHGNFNVSLPIFEESPYYVYKIWNENNQIFVAAYVNTSLDSLVIIKMEGIDCNSSDPALTVVTAPISNITASSAICGGEVISDGGSAVAARGVCWSTSPNPTIADSHTIDGVDMGNFTSSITGLTPNTTYYVRAYATNSEDTAYGQERSFLTNCSAVFGYDTLFFIKDDFNDGTINTDYWTYRGNAVIEEDGIMKIQQNVTDQDVRLISSSMSLPQNGQVSLDRKFMLHKAYETHNAYGHSFFYGGLRFRLNGTGDSYVEVRYYDTDYPLENWHGTYIVSNLNGVETRTRVGDAFFDTWLSEHIELDFQAGELSYSLDTLVATVSIPDLLTQPIAYYNIDFIPYGWWTEHWHNMDYVQLYSKEAIISDDTVELNQVACDSYTWNDVVYMESGDYTQSFTNIYGCDSIVTLHLTINHPTTTEFSAAACDRYEWNGQEYTFSGDFEQTLTAVNGCDSVVTLHLTINPNPNVQISGGNSINYGDSVMLTASGADSYQWSTGANTVSIWDAPMATTTYVVIGTTSAGCVGADSITVEVGEPSMDANLVLYLPMDGDLVDISGNANNGINFGATLTEDRFCRPNSAYEFSGVPNCDRIVVENNSSLQFDDAATFSMWFCMNGTRSMDGWGHLVETDCAHALFAKNDDFTSIGANVTAMSNGEFYVGGYSGRYSNSAGDTCELVQLNHWVQATFVYTTSYMEVYVNGKLLSHNDGSLNFHNTNNYDLSIGLLSGYWYPFNGKIDEFRVYNRALTATEVAALYYQDLIPKDSLVLYLPLDGNILDYSGNNYQPVLHGNLSMAEDRSGVDSSAYYFPEDYNSWIEVPHTEQLNLSGAFTVSAWYNRAADGIHSNILSKGRDIVSGWQLGTAGISVNGTSGSSTGIQDDFPSEQWYMTTGVLDPVAGKLRYYLDGEFISETDCPSFSTNTTFPLAVGRHLTYLPPTSSYSYPFKGSIDDIVIYHRALSDDEVKMLYRANTHALPPCNEPVLCHDTMVVLEADVCDSVYVFNGQLLTQSGNYMDTLYTVSGCDSVVTLHLTINHPTSATLTQTIVQNQLPYEWNGAIFTGPGAQTVTLTNNQGCDSVVTMILMVYSNMMTYENRAVCESELPYVWNGVVFSNADTQMATLSASTGADSVVVMTLMVTQTKHFEFTASACDFYKWNDQTYSISGDYTQTFTADNGCDSIVILHLTIAPVIYTDVMHSACESYVWNGVEYTTSGDYAQTFSGTNGCDSIVTLHLTIGHATSANLMQTIAEAQLPYEWNGVTFYDGGMQQVTLTNSQNCDSVLTMYLMVYYNTLSSDRRTVCESELPYEWNGVTFQSAGSKIVTLVASTGADSVVVMTLTVNPTIRSEVSVSSCDLYVWNGQTYGLSGDYEQIFTAANGCDSLVTLHLTIESATHTDITKTAFDSYMWNGVVYSESGDYVQTFANIYSCDSVVTLHLNIISSIYTDITNSACGSYVWNGVEYTASGDYTQTFATDSGRDSVVTLHLTIWPTNHTNVSSSSCGSYTWNGVEYTTSGDYTQTFTNIYGCDSVVTLHLTIWYADYTNVTISTCDSYMWNGIEYTTSGDYTQTFDNVHGCDSVVTLHLTINHSTSATLAQTIVQGQLPYEWNGVTFRGSNTRMVTLTNEQGCDSVITMNLTVLYNVLAYDTLTICEGELPFVWNGITFQGAGTQVTSLRVPTGADSIVVMTLRVTPTMRSEFSASACNSYEWNGQIYTSTGDFEQTFDAANGCDSVATLHLTIWPTDYTDITDTACGNYMWNGLEYTVSGNYTQILTNNHGCDSVVMLHLTIWPEISTDVTSSACDSYMWNGMEYVESGDYTQTFIGTNGCDSVVTLHLTIWPTHHTDVTMSACGSYVWNGVEYTEPGDYTQTFVSVYGCDSIVTLHLTILSTIYADVSNVTCGSYIWNGVEYTASGDYTQTLTAANGCDSVVTLHLTIRPTNHVGFTASACGSYMWNDVEYTVSGDYTQTFTNVHGCDSVVTLYLTVYQNASTEVDATVNNCYVWNGVVYTESGNYTQHFYTINGCDSLVTLHLIVKHDVVVITHPVANIDVASATCGGDIVFNGGPAVTDRGVCWNTSHNPTIANSHTSEGSGAGSFVSILTGLVQNTTYYVRAYATISEGTIYGEEFCFTTSCNPWSVYIDGSTFLCGGDSTTLTTSGAVSYLWSNGASGNSITVSPNTSTLYSLTATNEYGCQTTSEVAVEVHETPILNISGNTNISFGESTTLAANGADYYSWSTGLFSPTITVSPTVTTIYRVTGTTDFGCTNEASVTVSVASIFPTVVTEAITNIGEYSALSGGNVISSGGALVTARGVCWSTTSTPTIQDDHTEDGIGIGPFTSWMENLMSNTTYHVRAYATNAEGTAYGEMLEFSTSNVGLSGIDGAYSINAYPNPTRDGVTIEVKDAGTDILSVVIYDAVGRKLRVDKWCCGEQTQDVELREFEAGIYYLELLSANQNRNVVKIVIQ